jgi:chromate transport protein ChrA
MKKSYGNMANNRLMISIVKLVLLIMVIAVLTVIANSINHNIAKLTLAIGSTYFIFMLGTELRKTIQKKDSI